MSSKNLVDPELLPLLELMPSAELSDETIVETRQLLEGFAPPVNPEDFGARRREIFAPLEGLEGGVRCLVYEPLQPSETPRAGYFHIHGGGLVLGNADGSEAGNAMLAGQLNIIVVSVDYRLAPEHPYPAPLDDCQAGLHWMIENAAELGIDPARIGVGGESAGGCLAAGLVQRVCAEGKHKIAYQHLTFPMLDNRTSAPDGVTDPYVGEFVWTHTQNRYGWSSYLGDHPAEAPAVPARATSLEGMPPTWIATGGMDLFLDEDIDYARRLTAAGVATELIIYPSAPHGFMMLPTASVSQRYMRDSAEALARGLSISA